MKVREIILFILLQEFVYTWKHSNCNFLKYISLHHKNVMKLIAQKNNWILQNVVIMKINNCLTRVNHFSTHHQSSSNVILLWQNKYRIKWDLDLPFNWFILSPKELILTATTRTVNHNDVSKKLLRRFIFLLFSDES